MNCKLNFRSFGFQTCGSSHLARSLPPSNQPEPPRVPAPPSLRQPGSHLGTLAGAVAVHTARAGVLGSRRLPSPLLGGAVVVEVSAIGVLVGLPVAQDVERGAGGGGRRRRLGDLQLLEVGVDGRLGAALARRRHRLLGRQRERQTVSHQRERSAPLRNTGKRFWAARDGAAMEEIHSSEINSCTNSVPFHSGHLTQHTHAERPITSSLLCLCRTLSAI